MAAAPTLGGIGLGYRPELAADLRSGRVHPAMVDFDTDLRALGPELVAAVQAHYEPTGVSTLWRRKP